VLRYVKISSGDIRYPNDEVMKVQTSNAWKSFGMKSCRSRIFSDLTRPIFGLPRQFIDGEAKPAGFDHLHLT